MSTMDAIRKLVRKGVRFVKKNAPIIFAVGGCAGVVGTAILSAKAGADISTVSRKYEKRKNEQGNLVNDEGEELTAEETQEVRVEAGKEVIKAAVPAVVTGLATIGCVVGCAATGKANYTAAMGAAAAATAELKNYRKAATDIYGKEGDEKIREQADRNLLKGYRPSSMLLDELHHASFYESENNEVLCYYYDYNGTGTACEDGYFRMTLAEVEAVENNIMHQISRDGFITENDIYKRFHLKPTKYGDLRGYTDSYLWDQFEECWLTFDNKMEAVDIPTEDGVQTLNVLVINPILPAEYLDTTYVD